MSSFIKKYYPSNISEIYLPETISNKFKNLIENKLIPNMILSGQPGCGKTTIIHTMAKHIYKINDYNESVLELNASNNRGIDIINNTIIYFCKKKTHNPYKLIILDEADNITKKAQNALNNLIDEFGDTAKFVFTSNDTTKIIESIQSRCLIFHIPSVNNEFIQKQLIKICDNENIKYDMNAILALVNNSNGDMRQSINNLESIYMGFKEITLANVCKLCHQPKPDLIIQLIKQCDKKQTIGALKCLDEFKKEGYCGNDILLILINILKNLSIDIWLENCAACLNASENKETEDLPMIFYNEEKKIKYIKIISESYIKTCDGIDTNLQLYGCISRLILID